MRLYLVFAAIGAATLVFFISQLFLELYLENESWTIFSSHSKSEEDYIRIFKEVIDPVLVWWSPLGLSGNFGIVRRCGEVSCYVSHGRHFHHHPNTKAIMFYGSGINFTDLPLPRNSSSPLWALFHEESPRNVPPLSHLAGISLFNYTATFSRMSNFPLTTQYLKDLRVLTDTSYFVAVEEKNRLQKVEELAPVLYIQSDCSTMNNRDSYVVELSKHIKVDSYGACLHNKDMPAHLQEDFLNHLLDDDILHFVGKYKFMLAIENGICYDYITEKLWKPLIAGTVPIYIGSPTVRDWLPNNNSAILGLDFESPEELAKFLHQLNNNNSEYNSFLSHKLQSEVTNTNLIQSIEQRKWETDWTESGIGNYMESFECFVCRKAHSSGEVSVATTEHYHCPMPLSIVSRAPNVSNDWLNIWFYGACEATVIRDFVESGVSHFTQQQMSDTIKPLLSQGECQYSEKNAKNIIFN